MTEFLWRILARIAARPTVAAWLIERAQRTPYLHLDGYMNRWWLFNPTPPRHNGKGRRFEWLPSIRVHHILRADHARDHHNHPWPFRTIILRGWYVESRRYETFDDAADAGADVAQWHHAQGSVTGHHMRRMGDTATLDAEGFHHVSQVSEGGVYTLFISGRWRHTWGFKTAQGFVPWTEYPDVNP
jgi:hypothetical protein